MSKRMIPTKMKPRLCITLSEYPNYAGMILRRPIICPKYFPTGIICKFAKCTIIAMRNEAFGGKATAIRGKWTISWIVPNIFQTSCKEAARKMLNAMPLHPEKRPIITFPMSLRNFSSCGRI